MKRLAIIPARGGSKRIPKKNMRDFHGQPIIGYAIQLALKSNLFDEVFGELLLGREVVLA